MKKLLLCFIFSAVLFSCITPVQVLAEEGWNLTWSDEFTGSSINEKNWMFDIGTGSSGWGNNELQYYTNRKENLRIENGNLLIEARKESYQGKGYTSGRLKTQGLREFQYGKVEARMKLPIGQGIWPAFWMLGSNINQSVWPKCGEIDIMEHINKESVVHGTIHWDTNGYSYYGGDSKSLDVTQYHVYAIEWNKDSIQWFVDGQKYWEANISNNINGTEEFQKPFFLLLNLAVGGNWPGNPDGDTAFPAKMFVDYVRVYQKGEKQNTPIVAPEVGTTLSPVDWYLYNKPVSSMASGVQNMQVTKNLITGWQPIKEINGTPGVWTTPTIDGIYKKGTWKFVLWTNSPISASYVKAQLFKVNGDGSNSVLLGEQVINVTSTGGGNHPTYYSFSLDTVTLKNQRLMVKISRSSGVNAIMAYNTNDFPTRLITP